MIFTCVSREPAKKMIDCVTIRREAARLLLSQDFVDYVGMSLADMRRLRLGGSAALGTYSDYQARTGEPIMRPDSYIPDGLTVKYGSMSLILYNGAVKNLRRLNWTIAHEAWHVVLEHSADREREEREADIFASYLLIPIPLILCIEHKNGSRADENTLFGCFNVSRAACRRRRAELDRLTGLPYIPLELCESVCCREEEELVLRYSATIPENEDDEKNIESYFT